MTKAPPGSESELASLLRLVSSMARDEIALARAELTENLRSLVVGGVLVVVAALLLIVALNLLAAAAVAGAIAAGVPPPYAPLVVGVVTLLLAAFLAWRGLAALHPSRLYPARTAAHLRRDAIILKEIISHDTQT